MARLVSGNLHLLPLPASSSSHWLDEARGRERERDRFIFLSLFVSFSFEVVEVSILWLALVAFFVAGPKALISWVTCEVFMGWRVRNLGSLPSVPFSDVEHPVPA